jgi:hypothetical protein
MKLFIALFILAASWTLWCAARQMQVANRKPKPKNPLTDWRDWQKGVFK